MRVCVCVREREVPEGSTGGAGREQDQCWTKRGPCRFVSCRTRKKRRRRPPPWRCPPLVSRPPSRASPSANFDIIFGTVLNLSTLMRSGSEEGSYLKLVDVCITQLQAESNKEKEKKRRRRPPPWRCPPLVSQPPSRASPSARDAIRIPV